MEIVLPSFLVTRGDHIATAKTQGMSSGRKGQAPPNSYIPSTYLGR